MSNLVAVTVQWLRQWAVTSELWRWDRP